MDINSSDFQSLAPSILDAIAKAHFVTLDLELSGISSQQPNKVKVRVGDGLSGKPTLQHRYIETKIAAETYQVLQFGITCVLEDKVRGSYTVRSYNFYVNPVPDGRLDVERIFSFQSGALEFLLSHKFRIDAPFLEGVPYFSREEEVIARSIYLTRQRVNQEANIEIKDDDAESKAFLERARKEIDGWNNQAAPKSSFFNVAPVGYSSPTFQGRGLNNFQKRLIHQLVRSEYPGLTTISRPGFIQIVAYNQEREDAVQKARDISFEAKLTKQIGLRWLVEGMVGGDLTSIASWNSQPEMSNLKDRKPKFVELFDRLKKKRTVIVGHNIFIDLIYFYACFFGKLPDCVEDFQRVMHELFPIVVDTKYLATHSSDNAAISRSSLEELDEELSKLSVPVIESHPEHLKYLHKKPAHEAGFDSYLTAKVLIRLATKLKTSPPTTKQNSTPTPTEDSSTTATATNPSSPPPEPTKPPSGTSTPEGVPLPPSLLAALPQTRPPKGTNPNGPTPPTISFSQPTRFAALSVDVPPSDEDLIDFSSPSSSPGGETSKTSAVGMMPPWEDEAFWSTYGNRLRVNGTVEGVCCLGC